MNVKVRRRRFIESLKLSWPLIRVINFQQVPVSRQSSQVLQGLKINERRRTKAVGYDPPIWPLSLSSTRKIPRIPENLRFAAVTLSCALKVKG